MKRKVLGSDGPFEIIWDTGCCEHVADRADLVGYTVSESAGSRKGRTYNDASGNPLPNEGEVCTHLIGKNLSLIHI